MKGAIVQRFKFSELEKDLQTKKDAIKKVVIRNLCWVGEQCVKTARNDGNYNDITGNLRSSIGYVVLENGQEVSYAMRQRSKQIKGSAGNGKDGVKAGKELLEKLRGEYPRGFALIVVAGMQYAVYVEEVRGKNVLISSKQYAEQLVPKLLHDIGLK